MTPFEKAIEAFGEALVDVCEIQNGSLVVAGYSDKERLSGQVDEFGSLTTKKSVSHCNMKTSATLQADVKAMLRV